MLPSSILSIKKWLHHSFGQFAKYNSRQIKVIRPIYCPPNLPTISYTQSTNAIQPTTYTGYNCLPSCRCSIIGKSPWVLTSAEWKILKLVNIGQDVTIWCTIMPFLIFEELVGLQHPLENPALHSIPDLSNDRGRTHLKVSTKVVLAIPIIRECYI